MTLKSDIVINFDKSIKTATLDISNWTDNKINWDKVEGDLYMYLLKFYDIAEINDIINSDFDAYIKETLDWMSSCSIDTFDKFESLTLLEA
jgi:hypothetical protein